MADPALASDQELIQGIRSGDPGTLERLMAAYWAALVRYADGIVEGPSDPEDVVQEAFIRLWTRRDRWTEEGSVRSLLYTVTRNVALDERRRSARGERAARMADTPLPPGTPTDEASGRELERAAAQAVAALPPKRREVFRLSREEGLSYAEIASVMGVAPQTVANQMSLALADLRRALSAHLGPAPHA